MKKTLLMLAESPSIGHLYALDQSIANEDRNQGNILILGRKLIFAIDHGRTFDYKYWSGGKLNPSKSYIDKLHSWLNTAMKPAQKTNAAIGARKFADNLMPSIIVNILSELKDIELITEAMETEISSFFTYRCNHIEKLYCNSLSIPRAVA